MHEMALATAVAEIALAHAGTRRVVRLGLRVGRLRQVVPSALRFSFEVATRDTPLAGADLAIEDVPAVVRCARCGRESGQHVFPLRCLACGADDVEVVHGEEFLVDWLDLEVPDGAPAAPAG